MSTSQKKQRNPDAATRAIVAEAVRTQGVSAVARVLGMSNHSVMAVAAGAPVRAGTDALARERLPLLQGRPA